jgi:uncharacterized protein
LARFERDQDAAGPVVRGFSGGGFSIDGRVYRGVFLTPNNAFEWAPPRLAELAPAHFEQVLGLQPAPEFILLGTGPGLAFPPSALRQALEARGIGLEVMDSRAAARTWGLLRGEGRWIAAALMPLDE